MFIKIAHGTSPALGNQVQIKDDETGLYYRYCHMVYGSVNLNVGDRVDNNTIVGKMGTTGNSTRCTFTFRMYNSRGLEL